MPVFEATLDTVSEFPVLLVASGGNAVTGVVKAEVVPYFKKAGGAVTALPQADFDWTEEDATNMPGVYTLTINSVGVGNGRLDTMGSFLIFIKERTAAPAYVAYPISAYVVPMSYWETIRRTRAWHAANFRLIPSTYDPVSGEIETGTIRIYKNKADADADANHIEEGTLTAAYDTSGRVTSYRITVP